MRRLAALPRFVFRFARTAVSLLSWRSARGLYILVAAIAAGVVSRVPQVGQLSAPLWVDEGS